jgi:hypothetical protein
MARFRGRRRGLYWLASEGKRSGRVEPTKLTCIPKQRQGNLIEELFRFEFHAIPILASST